jgi:hypothetical protein
LDWQQQVELEFAMFCSEYLEIELFKAAPSRVEESTVGRWFQKAIEEKRYDLARFLASKYEQIIVEFSSFPLKDGQLGPFLVELRDFPRIALLFLNFGPFMQGTIKVPFLMAGTQLETLSSAELACLKAKSIEDLAESCSIESFRKQCTARFDELRASACAKKAKNDAISEFAASVLQSIIPKILKAHISLSVTFIDQPAFDSGGLCRHFLTLMLGLVADERFGCLLPSQKGDKRLCFAPFLEPKWAGIIGFLQAQAFLKEISPGFALDFDEFYGANEIACIDKLPSLEWLLDNLNGPPHKKFLLGKSVPNEQVNSPTPEYFLKLGKFNVLINEECRKEYWNCFCRVVGVPSDATTTAALQSLIQFSINARPNIEELMQVFHFECQGAPLIDGKTFPVVFDEICRELDAEWDEFLGEFLLFVRGSSSIPAQGLSSLELSVLAVLDENAKEEKDMHIPTSSTCEQSIRFNVPKDCTKAALKAKLKYALEHGKEYTFH